MTYITAQSIANARAMLLAEGSPFELDRIVTRRGKFTVYKNAPANLIEILNGGRCHGDAEFLVFEGERWTFDMFYRQVDRVRAQLVEVFGVRPGDSVAIAMRNYPEWLVAFAAAAFTGAVVAPLNSWGKGNELLRGISDTRAKVLFCDEERYRLIATQIAQVEIAVVVARSRNALAADIVSMDGLLDGPPVRYADASPVDSDAIAMVFYTSGSMGSPKGVMLTHRTVGQCLINLYFSGALCLSLLPVDPIAASKQVSPMVNLMTVPLFHVSGLLGSFLLPLHLGQKVVAMYKWDADKALRLIDQERVTNMHTSPAIVRSLLTHVAFDGYDTSSLNRISMGGAAVPADLPELIKAKLNHVSCGTGWGMTESCAVGAIISEQIFQLRPDSAGLVSPIIELRMVDGDGEPVPQGQMGEIECYGVTTTAGYWRSPEASAEIYRDGWLRTGDIGRIDDAGFLYITGRAKDIVIRGGEKIFPVEVEDVAYKQPDVEEVVVFGVPDQALGEELAMVFYAGRSGLRPEELRAYLSKNLAGFKVPKYIQAANEPLPLNVSSKLFRRNIRDNFIALHLAVG